MIGPEDCSTPEDYVHIYERAFHCLRKAQALRRTVETNEVNVDNPQVFLVGPYTLTNIPMFRPFVDSIRLVRANRFESQANYLLHGD